MRCVVETILEVSTTSAWELKPITFNAVRAVHAPIVVVRFSGPLKKVRSSTPVADLY